MTEWVIHKGKKRKKESIVELTCPGCGKKFKILKWKITQRLKKKNRKSNEIFCSHACVKPREDEFSDFRYLYRELKRRVKEYRGSKRKQCVSVPLDFEVDYIKYIYEKQNGKCALSGMQLEMPENRYTTQNRTRKRDGRNPRNASIDRIDPNLPYQKGNIQLLCVCMNYFKSDYTQKQALQLLEEIRGLK